MKKVLAMLLAIVMVVALCACGNQNNNNTLPNNTTAATGDTTTDDGKTEDKDDEADSKDDDAESIIGEWSGKMDLAAMLGLDGEDVDEELEWVVPVDLDVIITMEFDDEECTLTIEAEDAFAEWEEQAINNFAELLKEELEANDSSVEEFEEEAGMSLEEYAEKEVLSEIDFEDTLSGSDSGEYTLDGDELYFGDDDYYTVKLTSSKLTFEDYSEGTDDPFVGLSLKRQ